jgi:hypothetical protein
MTQIEEQLLRNQIEIMVTLNRVCPAAAQGRLDRAIVNSERLLTTTIQREVASSRTSGSLLACARSFCRALVEAA